MVHSHQKAMTQRIIKEIWNMGNIEAVDKHFAPEFTLQLPSDKITGRDHFKRWLRSMRTAFPDLSIKLLDDPIAEGNRVAIRWHLTGTHKGWLDAIPPAGKKIKISGMSIFQFEKRQVTKIWHAMDELSLMRQLELPMPEPAIS